MAKRKLTRISTVELRRELDRRIAQASTLESKRIALADKLSRIDAEISALSGDALSIGPTATKRPHSRITRRHGAQTDASRTRAANEVPLAKALHQVLKGKTMSVAEVADAVRAAGYKSHAASFRTIVNMTLVNRKDLFKRKGRGRYTAK